MQKTMKEEKPKNCKALITTRDTTVQPNSSLSHLMNQPKIKIKIPKLIVNTLLRRRNHKCSDTNNGDQNKSKKKWAKPRRLLPKKLSSILHNVFGNKNSKEISHCNVEETNDLSISQDYSIMSKSHSLNEILEIEDRLDEQRTHKQPLKVPLSMCLSSFNGGVSAMGKHESSSILYRAPSRRLKGYRQIRRAKSMRKKVNKQVGEESEEEDDDEELCKKRILMGERCRPLHLSGTLNYDKNGILLPEELPCEEL